MRSFVRLPGDGTTVVFLDTPPAKFATLRKHALTTSDEFLSEDADEVLFVVGDDLTAHHTVVVARRVRLRDRRQSAHREEPVEQREKQLVSLGR